MRAITTPDIARRDALELPPVRAGANHRDATPIGDRYQRIEAARRAREQGGVS